MNALHCRHNTVHPRERLLVCAIRFLLRDHHNPLVMEDAHREDSDPALVHEGVRLHGHHSRNEVLSVVSPPTYLYETLQGTTDKH